MKVPWEAFSKMIAIFNFSSIYELWMSNLQLRSCRSILTKKLAPNKLNYPINKPPPRFLWPEHFTIIQQIHKLAFIGHEKPLYSLLVDAVLNFPLYTPKFILYFS